MLVEISGQLVLPGGEDVLPFPWPTEAGFGEGDERGAAVAGRGAFPGATPTATFLDEISAGTARPESSIRTGEP